MNNPIAFLMIGPPGAGKSTYARKLSKETGAYIIEGDEIRSQVGKQMKRPAHWTELEDAIEGEIQEILPESLILDGPHCDRLERRQAVDLLQSYGYDVVAVVLKTPLETCILRNATRHRSVPRHAITRWENRLEKELSSLPTEPFKEIITIS
jgi:predicted kinase